MIRRIQYKDINFSQYEKCIGNSVQKNFYAKKEVLDQLSNSWEILVHGDYDSIMPIPFRKKYGFKIVIMPLFCQQLGIFGAEKNPDIEQQFLNYFRRNYRILYYAFNYHNAFKTSLVCKKNYFIPNIDYNLLRKRYFKGRKSTVKVAQHLQYKEIRLQDEISFIRTHFKGLQKESDLEKFFEYLAFLEKEKQLKIVGSYLENQLTNAAILVENRDSLALLGLINDEKYRQDNGASFLIDRILKENIHVKSFDFMGSIIRGIEVFFKSFGADLQEYAVIENRKIDLIKNIFRK